ncbi:MAG: 2-oxoglutarate dehydrogenase complex dihydrolipoyllysine-residue succinyltransferase [Betaproteobacteria bacterium]|nr:MAG: 2-oxoglutarate dehydrogenase complex dihydrolipoyllysine-residue succinyltransferase [Betaproteobacteria bacterium]
MLVEVKVPQLSESVAEATLLSWHKKVGDAVIRDENLIDVETDKVVLELPAPAGGVITRIVKVDGDTVVAGEVIAVIDTAADSAAAVAKAAERPAAPVVQAAQQLTDQSNLMPAARKMVEDNKLDPLSIAGSGRDGRVTKADVVAHMEGGAAAKPASLPAAIPPAAAGRLPQVPAPMNVDQLLADRPQQRVPMSRLRARVAERLLQSQSSAAILTTFNEVNMQPVMDLRSKHKDKFEREHGVKLGFMSFFVKAAVYALKKYPIVNASVDGNEIVYHGYFDIGVAVGSPRGLVVPVLRDADQMNFAQIEKTIADLGKRAGEGKLTMEELTGGTFSISNGGVFGSMLSTPIINPPQSAILGIHATKERAVVENGQIVIRPMNYFALSYDHRIIDGREAVLALVAMKDALEDPMRLLLEL